MRPEPVESIAAAPAATALVPLRRGIELRALAALFGLTLRQHVRGRRLLILMFLFTLPSLVAILARATNENTPIDKLQFGLIFTLIPHALAPLAALLYASGMIQDEIEEQTLTYLLVRPLPRWTIYTTKLAATILVTALLAAVFTFLTYAAVNWGRDDFWGKIMPNQAAQTATLLALAVAAYCSIFGLISLFARRSLVVGVAYIILFEGVLANIDFVVRRFTVMYYYRVLCERWLGLNVEEWSLDLSKAPDATECVLTLVAASVVATALAATIFATREFRVKTPEGS
jgi:ABC-2 type transport system permease protein